MKMVIKYAWIAALMVALLLGSCAKPADFDPDAPDWEFAASVIELVAIGGAGAVQSVEDNTYTLNSSANQTSAGFKWVLPEGDNAGYGVGDYEKVVVTMKIDSIVTPTAGVSFNAKDSGSMGTDVNRFGETAQYANDLTVLGVAGDEDSATFPLQEFKGEIAFQWGNWADALGGATGTASQNFTISITSIKFTNN